ncbi:MULTISPECIES: WXG100 family type VII secretion target [Streptomycetaceae]|jgi:WXG100 family type VII secretion target|uniref:ESAT-6-like protein n=2 Tax=Actinacidiphila TaxID=2995702 RepID=A0A9W4ECM3_9ACTN|nr:MULTISPECIES: WXG100 family type VII secretion target [Actinacidiphila]MBM9435628.1 WXG100 family type VII secretion target [Actinacidiphila bryophytorum]MBN6543314.1 WXG100 family type VII secretion target [Actinacidiphila bryophytorum]UWE11872.1 WXG100 family type VII secretion target [Actinacidiphila bryophytorum]CAG7610159.1 ESAT-6-like protein [Actinacidiphila bryophytorum]SHM66229.1 WXG100 family type VII secretion target [Actinacidiphila paucisporea]
MSDPGELKVTYSSLDEAAGAIKQQAGQLETDLDNLLTRVRAVAAYWEGDAQTAFHAVANEWANRTHHMHEVLESIASKVQIASGHYNAADKKAASYFG